MRALRVTFLTLFFALSSLCTSAQTVRWHPGEGTLPLNQSSELQLVYENCEPSEDPATPQVPGLTLQQVGRSSNTSIINGRVSQSVTIGFQARASQRTTLTIPAFSVETNKGAATVAPATYQVGDATVGQAALSLDRVANSQLQVPRHVWAGEVFSLEYGLNVARRYFHSMGTNVPEWNPAPLAVEDWAKPEVQETITGGEQRVIVLYRTRASAKNPGDIQLNSASQLINLATGSSNFGLFSRPNLEQFAITSSRPTITVKPLPNRAPASFDGAVGQFKLESKVVPESAAVGEPITWTLSLSGIGNWPDNIALPARDVSRDFRPIQPQARKTMKDGALYEGTLVEDVVLIPTQPGNYKLGPITWSFFDPEKGEYQTVTTPEAQVTVTAAAGSRPGDATSTGGAGTGLETGSKAYVERTPAVAPPAPSMIPRDPLPTGRIAPGPWTNRTFLSALSAPFALLVIGWLALALKQARRTDPLRTKREAYIRLGKTSEALSQAGSIDTRRALLKTWQDDVVVVLGLSRKAPSSRDFEGLASTHNKAAMEAWSGLWRDAERARFGPEFTLPSDWSQRAKAAISSINVPRFSALQLFRPSNLLPFAAALVVATTLANSLTAQTDPRTSYRTGDFVTAESVWRKEVEKAPRDWAARHNLSLALSQQNRWGEALGHALAAFTQNPGDDAVRWNLALASERAAIQPGSLAAFVSPTGLHAAARWLSVANWQRVMVAGAAVLSLSLFLILAASYGFLPGWIRRAGLGLILVAGAVQLVSGVSLLAYREAKYSDAAYVWKQTVLRSIPLEAETNQKTSQLAAGTVARVDRTYLTWSRLLLENGQTGWVRSEDLVHLWR